MLDNKELNEKALEEKTMLAQSKEIIVQKDSAFTTAVILPEDIIAPIINSLTDSTVTNSPIKPSKKRNSLAFSVTTLAGPEFSSVSSIAGRNGRLTVGLLMNASIFKKVILSSGVKYGIKKLRSCCY